MELNVNKQFIISNLNASFYARFSHEMRTTLTGVVGFSEYIEHSVNGPMMKFASKAINQSGKDVLRLTSAYFDLFRLQSGEINFQFSKFNVAEVVNEVMLQARESAALRSVRVILSCDDAVWAVRAESDLGFFKRLIDLLLQDFIWTSKKEDLIQIELRQDGLEEYFQLRFYRSLREPDVGWIALNQNFWSDCEFLHEKQEGPGVGAVLAKNLIYGLQGRIACIVVDDKTFALDTFFPVNIGRI